MADWTDTELEIPTEYHSILITYLDAMWARHKLDITSSKQLMTLFDQEAIDAGIRFKRRRDVFPSMRGNYF